MRNYKMLRELHAQFPQVVILAFPTREFLSQEFKEPPKVKAFAAKHGPPGMVVLMTKTLAKRPGWWMESQPSWNFKGKWLVSPTGARTLVDDPLPAVAAAVGANPEPVPARRPSAERYEEPYQECGAKCEDYKELLNECTMIVAKPRLVALMEWRKNYDREQEGSA